MNRTRTFVLLALVVAAGLAHAFIYRFPFEDSYITFRYTRNLLDGYGLVYNPGEAVEGFSSFGWVMLLAGSAWTGVALPSLARGFSWLAGAGLLTVSASMARRWAPDARWRWLAVPMLVGAHGTFAFYTASGMETTLFALLVLGAALMLFGDGRRDGLLAGLLLALSGVVRPEGLGYFLVLAAALSTFPKGRRVLPWTVGAFCCVFLPYFLWRWHHFGYLAPNTFYAKAPSGSQGLIDGVRYAEGFLTLYAFWLVAPMLALLGRHRGWDGPWRLLTALLVGAMVDAILVGGDTFAFYRFFLPAIPAGCLVLTEGVALLVHHPRFKWTSLRRAAGVQLAATLAIVGWTACSEFLPRYSLFGYQGKSFRTTVLDVAQLNSHYFLVGAWLRTALAPDTLIAVNAAGIVPYVSRLPTLDMLGLNDVHIAHTPVSGRLGAIGHQRHDVSYVLARRPGVILPGLPILSTTPLRSGDVLPWFEQWFPFLPGDESLFRAPGFQREYRLVNVEIRPHAWLALFLRNDLNLPMAPAARPQRHPDPAD